MGSCLDCTSFAAQRVAPTSTVYIKYIGVHKYIILVGPITKLDSTRATRRLAVHGLFAPRLLSTYNTDG